MKKILTYDVIKIENDVNNLDNLHARQEVISFDFDSLFPPDDPFGGAARDFAGNERTYVQNLCGWLDSLPEEYYNKKENIKEALRGLAQSVNLMKTGIYPLANDEKKCQENWDNGIQGLRSNCEVLNKELNDFNKKSDYTYSAKPQMQALCDVLRGFSKLDNMLQQTAANQQMEVINKKLPEMEKKSARFLQLRADLKKSEYDADKGVDISNLDADIEKIQKERADLQKEIRKNKEDLAGIRISSKEHLDRLNALSLENNMIDWRNAAWKRKKLEDALDRERKQDPVNAAAQKKTEQYLRTEKAAEETAKQKVKAALLRINADTAETTLREMEEDLFTEKPEEAEDSRRRNKNVAEVNKMLANQEECNAIELYLKHLQSKENYLRKTEERYVKVRETRKQLTEEFGNDESFATVHEHMKYFNDTVETCGHVRLDPLMEKLKAMYDRIDEKKEDAHENTPEFKTMKEMLGRVVTAWKAAEGEGGLTREMLQDAAAAANHYLEKKKGILGGLFHSSTNVMRHYRLTFAKDMKELTDEADKCFTNAFEEKKIIEKRVGPVKSYIEDGRKNNFNKMMRNPGSPDYADNYQNSIQKVDTDSIDLFIKNAKKNLENIRAQKKPVQKQEQIRNAKPEAGLPVK